MKAKVNAVNSKNEDIEFDIDLDIAKHLNIGDYINYKDEYGEECVDKVEYKWYNMVNERLIIQLQFD